ncbi:MAG: beta-lactamase family protein [Acidobacteria bacterium]|nr:beta-lactamase family protein [Acidobacteriota bacterium]
MRTRLIGVIIVAVGLTSAIAARQTAVVQAPDLEKALAEFKTLHDTGLRQNGIVGSSVMIVRAGQVLFRNFAGSANLEKQQAVDEQTIYHWASITKTFTSIAIMQLRDRGLLALDDPIVKYLPELRAVHDPFGDVSEITLRHLMTHSAGFRDPTWPWGGDKPWHPHEPTRWEQVVAMLPYTEILFKPGSKYSYSNPGIIFLGRVIEILTGDDYEVYIDKNIFKPLGMSRSYFDATPYHLLPHRSASYYVTDGKRTPARFDVDTGITVSNGGLNAPLGDMVIYLDFVLGNPTKQATYDGVLKRSSLEEMFRPGLEISAAPGAKVAMGLTFWVEDYDGLRLIGHSGTQNGFISHFYVDPGSRSGYVIAFNTQAETSGKPSRDLTRLLDADIRSFLVARVFPLLR